jgi:hypothetical protein
MISLVQFPRLARLAVCLLWAAGVVVVRQERGVLALFGAGMAAWAAGYGYYLTALQDPESSPRSTRCSSGGTVLTRATSLSRVLGHEA